MIHPHEYIASSKFLWIILAFCFFFSSESQSSEFPPGYAVASAHPLATNAGLEILASGGNAFDAAVAVAAALAVVEPYHSGLGGGGFWLLHQEKNHKNLFIDGREVAPLAAKKDMYLAADGSVIPGLSLNGGLSAAIPGQPAAMVYIAKKYGRLPLEKIFAPAIKLAQEGFLVDKQLNYFLNQEDRLEQIKKYPATAAIFLKNGHPYLIGERLIQKDLANTLKLIVKQGEKGFYAGKTAERLVKGVNAAGGIWTLDDLSRYQLKIREPLVGAYHNMLIITAPPPSAGGVALLTMLNILSHYSLSSLPQTSQPPSDLQHQITDQDSLVPPSSSRGQDLSGTLSPCLGKMENERSCLEVQWIHYLVESMRLAYWQREQFLGDPDFIKIPIEKLISAENGKRLSNLISPNKATPSRSQALQNPQNHSKNTTHMSILDAEGNRVAATMTVNYIFGSSVVAEGTGVLLNDEMDDFSSKVGEENVFGIVGSDKNAIAPGKRPVSSMAPTFLELPGRVAVLGTPGGSRIPTMILIASLIFNDAYGAISMVSAMRFHHQYLPDVLFFEPDTFSPVIQDALKAMGYLLKPLDQYYGNMQAITWDKQANLLTAASDPRGIGLAASVVTTPSGYGVKY